LQSVGVGDLSVSTNKIQDNAITTAKIAAGAVIPADLSTGAPSWTTSGAVILQGGDTGANGIGITFPATQSASSNANTLDDYEEGTWTPSIGGTATYGDQIGRYTKIGRLVIVDYILGITTRGTGSTTDISGLPFAINSAVQASGLVSYYLNLAVNVIGISAYGFNASTFRFYGRDTAGVTANGPLAIFGNGAYIQGNLIYYTT
jgi:hypothetical protein